MPLEIAIVPCLSDNYAYVMRDQASGKVGVVDVPDALPVLSFLEKRNWPLDFILVTHHHQDHTAGVDELRRRFGAKVVGAVADEKRLPALDVALREGERIEIGESGADVIDVSGHTIGHIAYYFKEASAMFTGDSLMTLGCGRLFEGRPEQMWDSLTKLAALPEETLVYSGHEYAASNAKFALSIEPDNPALKSRAQDITRKVAGETPTVPVSLRTEKETNPFLRCANPEFKQYVGLADHSDAQVFAEIRRRKDCF
ncbi:MAG: hydroxyacylglutathione hydrolase [Pseudomonadota bacterium]